MDNIAAAAVVGLGLIGGSIARALRYKCDIPYIIGIDKNADYIRAALEDNVISDGMVVDNSNISASIDADIVFICTPVPSVKAMASAIIPHVKKGCIITDTASVKAPIMHDIETILHDDIIFIGGHPMAGTEKSGYHAGNSRLLENAYYILTPPSVCDDEALDKLSRIIRSIGAIPLVMDADTHDEVVAVVSHLPHVLASSLIHFTKEQHNAEHMKMLAAGAFRDMTRIAASNPYMWREICMANASAVKRSIDDFIAVLSRFANMLDDKDAESILSYFIDAKQWRSDMPIVSKSYVYPTFDIIVDVDDKPGIIGEIATLLGQHSLNIKNIGILNSREDTSGALKISFGNKETQRAAVNILQSHDYKVFADS
ncbi:prephenate dehydrogenase [Mahella sp.]|uniref:prephenate dehydrogenase n=1 Tax=Mahella sp. TaxID=2798721 RepID=UPI0025C23AED|nr:prephenate dehydrogenase [Mahella sp.]MBZ4666203.1 Prephenate dehydrogenase [Mahella sp.]MDK2902843.1 prephenate dehydrogenase [Clostridiales bacterium]